MCFMFCGRRWFMTLCALGVGIGGFYPGRGALILLAERGAYYAGMTHWRQPLCWSPQGILMECHRPHNLPLRFWARLLLWLVVCFNAAVLWAQVFGVQRVYRNPYCRCDGRVAWAALDWMKHKKPNNAGAYYRYGCRISGHYPCIRFCNAGRRYLDWRWGGCFSCWQ